jgi:hypothetical protein
MKINCQKNIDKYKKLRKEIKDKYLDVPYALMISLVAISLLGIFASGALITISIILNAGNIALSFTNFSMIISAVSVITSTSLIVYKSRDDINKNNELILLDKQFPEVVKSFQEALNQRDCNNNMQNIYN